MACWSSRSPMTLPSPLISAGNAHEDELDDEKVSKQPGGEKRPSKEECMAFGKTDGRALPLSKLGLPLHMDSSGKKVQVCDNARPSRQARAFLLQIPDAPSRNVCLPAKGGGEGRGHHC